jgi:hypothetical protein
MLMLMLAAMMAGAATAQAPAVPAQPERPAQGALYSRPFALFVVSVDANGDHATSREEMIAGVRRTFKQHDENADGALSLIELSYWGETELGDRGATPGQYDFDANGDDRVSAAEFEATLLRWFDRADADKSASLVRSELLSRLPVIERKDGKPKPTTAAPVSH